MNEGIFNSSDIEIGFEVPILLFFPSEFKSMLLLDSRSSGEKVEMDSIQDITRDRLAGEVLERIRSDAGRASRPEVSNLLNYIRDHLFDPSFSISQAYSACNIQSGYITQRFRAEFEDPPKTYVQKRRIEVGTELLLHTAFEVYEIASLIGFGSGQAFGLAFKEAKSLPPGRYRARWQNGVESLELLDPDLRQKTMELDEEEARVFFSFFEGLFPTVVSGDSPPLQYQQQGQFCPGYRAVSEEEFESLMAQRLWWSIQGLNEEEQKREISSQRFKTPALFDLLMHKVIPESRHDRTKGLSMAWLTLEAATVSERLSNGRGALRAKAWASIGNAQRLLFEFDEAERSYSMAENFLPKDSLDAKAEILYLKAVFRWYQKKHAEGLLIAEEAVRILEDLDDSRALANALICRGNLLLGLSRIKEARDNYTRALLQFSLTDTEMRITASINLALCYWMTNDNDSALEALAALKREGHLKHFGRLECFAKSLEGRIDLDERRIEQSISNLEAAYSGFSKIKSRLASLVGLDLAIAYFFEGDMEKTFKFLGETLETVSVWRNFPDFEVAYQKMERSVTRRLIAIDDLMAFQKVCDELGHDPESRTMIGLKGMT